MSSTFWALSRRSFEILKQCRETSKWFEERYRGGKVVRNLKIFEWITKQLLHFGFCTMSIIVHNLRNGLIHTITATSRFIVTPVAVASIWSLRIDAVWVGRATVTSFKTFVNVNTRIMTMVSPTRKAAATVRALCIDTPRIGWAPVWSLRTLINIDASVRTLIPPTRQAVTSIRARRV